MTTTTTLSAELEQLTKTREKTYDALQKVKRDREAWDEGTEVMRGELTVRRHSHPHEHEGSVFTPKPGTQAAKLADAVKKRLREPHPHQADYDSALAEFHAADELCQQFRRRHVAALVDERVSEVVGKAEDDLREAGRLAADACARYQGAVAAARDEIVATPGLNGQHYGHDSRPEQWAQIAAEMAEVELVAPGLTPYAAAKVAEHA